MAIHVTVYSVALATLTLIGFVGMSPFVNFVSLVSRCAVEDSVDTNATAIAALAVATQRPVAMSPFGPFLPVRDVCSQDGY